MAFWFLLAVPIVVIGALIRYRLRINALSTWKIDATTPDIIRAVIRRDNLNLVALLSSGSNPDIIWNGSEAFRTYVCDETLGLTPLMLAAQMGSVGMVRALVEGGAIIDFTNGYGDTALHHANIVEVVEILIEAGADVNRLSRLGDPPLVSTAASGDAAIASALIRAGADINIQSSEGDSPLIEAAWAGNYEVVELLIRYGADPALRNKEGLTALQVAKSKHRRRCVEALTQYEKKMAPR